MKFKLDSIPAKCSRSKSDQGNEYRIMNININLQKYADLRIKTYESLRELALNSIHQHHFEINACLLNRLTTNFADVLARRSEPRKYTRKESKEFKARFLGECPEFHVIASCQRPAIYSFVVDDIQMSEAIQTTFKHLQENNKSGLWLSQFVEGKHSKSLVIYVGVVEVPGTLFKRFLEHLGLMHQKTSSLQLLHWAGRIDNIKLTYKYFEIANENFYPAIEEIEGLLYYMNCPVLGKSPRRGISSEIKKYLSLS